MGSEIRVVQPTRLTPDEAFDAWTDADRLAAWWWPHLADAEYTVDARRGGSYEIWCDALGIGAHGDYTAVERPSRLAFTWVWDGDGGHPPEPVTVTITAAADGSIVEVVHDCSGDAAAIGDLRRGWTDVLARLGSSAPEQMSGGSHSDPPER